MKTVFLFFLIFLFSCSSYEIKNDYKIVAHRGYWQTEGSADNSIASLKKAIRLGVDGIELDICVTKDDSIIVIHGPKHAGMDIANTNFDKLWKVRLSNGERISTFRGYLQEINPMDVCSYFVELKTNRQIKEIVEIVNEHGLMSKVHFLSFDWQTCRELRSYNESYKISYLGGNKTPLELKDAELTGFSYELAVLKKKPEWIKEAKEYGLTTNVWVVKTESDLLWCVNNGVEYITTDNPLLMKSFLYSYK